MQVALCRWQADEAPTYAMMDALMQGSGPSSGSSKSSKLQKAKNRVVCQWPLVTLARHKTADAEPQKVLSGICPTPQAFFAGLHIVMCPMSEQWMCR